MSELGLCQIYKTFLEINLQPSECEQIHQANPKQQFQISLQHVKGRLCIIFLIIIAVLFLPIVDQDLLPVLSYISYINLVFGTAYTDAIFKPFQYSIQPYSSFPLS